MTSKQKANIIKFKKVVAEAKKLRSKDPKLTQGQAVKKAWAMLYPKPKKVAGSHKDTKSHNVNIKVVSGIKNKKKIGYSELRLKTDKELTKTIKNQPKELFPYTKKQSLIKAGKKYFDEMNKKLHSVSGVKKIKQIYAIPYDLTLSIAKDDLKQYENNLKWHTAVYKSAYLTKEEKKKLKEDIKHTKGYINTLKRYIKSKK